jgi:hypothetical protein
MPMANAHVQDDRFRHILRLRFGVLCVTPLGSASAADTAAWAQ